MMGSYCILIGSLLILGVSCGGQFHRYYNTKNGDHFYTRNYNELKDGDSVWRYEGIQCHILEFSQSNAVPLYRYVGRNDHFYTTNFNEIGTSEHGKLGNYGYKSEGIAGWCFPEKAESNVPLYRYYNSGSGDHFYTTNANEIGTTTPGQIGKYGYKSEGVACYVYPTQ